MHVDDDTCNRIKTFLTASKRKTRQMAEAEL